MGVDRLSGAFLCTPVNWKRKRRFRPGQSTSEQLTPGDSSAYTVRSACFSKWTPKDVLQPRSVPYPFPYAMAV